MQWFMLFLFISHKLNAFIFTTTTTIQNTYIKIYSNTVCLLTKWIIQLFLSLHVCGVLLHDLSMPRGFPPGTLVSFLQSKEMCCRLTGISKGVWVGVCWIVPCSSLASCPGCPLPYAPSLLGKTPGFFVTQYENGWIFCLCFCFFTAQGCKEPGVYPRVFGAQGWGHPG